MEGHEKEDICVTEARSGLRDGPVSLTLELKKGKGGRPPERRGNLGGLEGLDDSEAEAECQVEWMRSGLQTRGR